MSALRSLLLPLVVLALSPACKPVSEPSRQPGPATEALEPGASCSHDAECRKGLACDDTRRICICTSNEACPGGWVCNPFSGRCVSRAAGCGSDRDCGEGRWCDERRRLCRDLRAYCETCELDGDCGPGNFCGHVDDGGVLRCGSSCDSDAECGEGSSCVDRYCRPAESCADVLPCTPGSHIVCEDDEACLKGERCDLGAGRCVAPNSGCRAGRVCDPIRLRCIVACDPDRPCPRGLACVDGACLDPPACQTQGDCARGLVCREGRCVDGCDDSDDCPIGTVCDVASGRCNRGCRSSADCPLHERCEQLHGCIGGPRVCQVSDVCPNTCERCVNETCVPARDLSVPELRYCSPCSGDGLDPACGAGGVCLRKDGEAAGHCAPPCPEEGCPRGFFCQRAADLPGEPRVCVPNDLTCDTECAP